MRTEVLSKRRNKIWALRGRAWSRREEYKQAGGTGAFSADSPHRVFGHAHIAREREWVINDIIVYREMP